MRSTTKVSGIVRHLNQKYWGVDSDDAHFLIEGSWGKDTQTRPPRDVDLLYVLPYDVYQRFEVRQGNQQSQLVLEIKGTLKDLHQNTRMRGDGQVVIVDFANAHGVEVLPAFELQNGQVLYLHHQEQWLIQDHRSGSGDRGDRAV